MMEDPKNPKPKETQHHGEQYNTETTQVDTDSQCPPFLAIGELVNYTGARRNACLCFIPLDFHCAAHAVPFQNGEMETDRRRQ